MRFRNEDIIKQKGCQIFSATGFGLRVASYGMRGSGHSIADFRLIALMAGCREFKLIAHGKRLHGNIKVIGLRPNDTSQKRAEPVNHSHLVRPTSTSRPLTQVRQNYGQKA